VSTAVLRTSKGRTGPQTWVALLRGVNLGARNKVSMADLRELFRDLGAEDVTTYVQSGNVVFRSSAARGDLVQAIENEIRSRTGIDLTVVLRTKEELARLVAGNPFAHQPDPTKLHVTFLAAPPDRRRVDALAEKRFEPDEFRVTQDAAYLHCPGGYGRSKLSNAFFETHLGVAATTRNWRTVTTLADLASN
jgi:uncharacterized protein (DUF1697 family)